MALALFLASHFANLIVMLLLLSGRNFGTLGSDVVLRFPSLLDVVALVPKKTLAVRLIDKFLRVSEGSAV